MLNDAEQKAAQSGQGIEVAYSRFERALQETKPSIFVHDYMDALEAICLHLAYVERQSAAFARLHGFERDTAGEHPDVNEEDDGLRAQWQTVFRRSA